MQFLNAAFLWAGFAILIPPIIHLFNFRRYKTVYFSDVRFLQNMKNINRQRSTLRQILLMIARMLVIAMLVFAFAEPVIYKNQQDDAATRKSAPPIIYIDNSQSMEAGAISGLNLETAKTKALEIVDAFPKGTDFMLITNDFEQRHNRLVKADGIRLFLQEITTSPRVPTLGQVIERACMSLSLQDVDRNANKNIFIISDFQKNICDFSSVPADSTLSVSLIGISAENMGNLAIDTIEFNTPYRMNGSEENITVTVHNYGSKPLSEVPIKLSINGATKLNEIFDINPYERKEIQLKYVNSSSKNVKGKVSIADFPISYDNDLYFSYNIDSVRNVLILCRNSNKYLKALLGRDANFCITEAESINNLNPADFHAIVISGLQEISHETSNKIQAYVAQGGNAIFIPAENGNIESYNYLLSLMECNTIISADTTRCKVSKINAQSQLLKNAIKQIPDNPDLPYLSSYYNSMSNSYEGEEIVLETNSYKKVLSSNAYRAGKIHVFYTPLSEKCGNLATHRVIVPILYNAVSSSQNFGQQYYSVIGNDNGFDVKFDKTPDLTKIFLKAENSDNEFIPRISGPDVYMNYKIFSENFVELSGFYTLMVENKEKEAIAYNFDRKESDMDFFAADHVAELLEGKGLMAVRTMDAASNSFATDAVASASMVPLWRIFIVLGLFFIIAEIIISRFV